METDEYKKGYDAGKEDGHKEGYEEAQSEAQAEIGELKDNINSLIKDLRGILDDMEYEIA